MHFWTSINSIAREYKPILYSIDVLFNIVIGIGLFVVARKANNIAKSNLELAKQEEINRNYQISKDDREVFYSVYSKLSKAIGLVLTNGQVDNEARALFWQARDRARLELPTNIKEYTQQLFDTMNQAYILYHTKLYGEDPLPQGEERSKLARQHMDIITQVINAKPYEVFSPYLTLKDKFK